MSEATLSLTAVGCDTARSLKRRNYLLMLSVFLVDMALTAIFMTVADVWYLFWRTASSSALMLLVANFFLARWQFAPIARFLDGKSKFADIERRMTQLPRQSARNVMIVTLPLLIFRLGSPFIFPMNEDLPLLTPLDAVTTILVGVDQTGGYRGGKAGWQANREETPVPV